MSERERILHAMTQPNAWGHYRPEAAELLLDTYCAKVLRKAEAGKDTYDGTQPGAGESTQPAGFFQPGHTYRRLSHGQVGYFRVEHVATAPDRDYRRAFGWYCSDHHVHWHGYFQDQGEFDGWSDVTQPHAYSTHQTNREDGRE
jgi:hypothetical protein